MRFFNTRTGDQKSELEMLKEDLRDQLTLEDIDWDYFIEVAERAKEVEYKEKGVCHD